MADKFIFTWYAQVRRTCVYPLSYTTFYLLIHFYLDTLYDATEQLATTSNEWTTDFYRTDIGLIA